MITPFLLLLLAATASPVDEAERLAAEAIRTAESRPADAVALARRALAVTSEFDPIAFVRAGRRVCCESSVSVRWSRARSLKLMRMTAVRESMSSCRRDPSR